METHYVCEKKIEGAIGRCDVANNQKDFAKEESPKCDGGEYNIVKTGSAIYLGCCNCTAVLQHVQGKMWDEGKVSIPPWKINLVSLGDECKFESIPIPNEAGTSNINTVEEVKCVCAVTVNTLLRQIAGLTSVAQSRSLGARDMLQNMQRHHDKVIQEMDGEIACLRAQIDRLKRGALGPSNVGSRMRGTPITQEITLPVDLILDKFDIRHENEVETNVDPIAGFSTNVTHYKLENSTGFTSDSDSETDTQVYTVSGLPYGDLKVEASVPEKFQKAAGLHIVPDDVLMKSKHCSKSECPMDIVYGHPKMTRSG